MEYNWKRSMHIDLDIPSSNCDKERSISMISNCIRWILNRLGNQRLYFFSLGNTKPWPFSIPSNSCTSRDSKNILCTPKYRCRSPRWLHRLWPLCWHPQQLSPESTSKLPGRSRATRQSWTWCWSWESTIWGWRDWRVGSTTISRSARLNTWRNTTLSSCSTLTCSVPSTESTRRNKLRASLLDSNWRDGCRDTWIFVSQTVIFDSKFDMLSADGGVSSEKRYFLSLIFTFEPLFAIWLMIKPYDYIYMMKTPSARKIGSFSDD